MQWDLFHSDAIDFLLLGFGIDVCQGQVPQAHGSGPHTYMLTHTYTHKQTRTTLFCVQVCETLSRTTGLPKEELYDIVDRMQVRVCSVV